MARDDAPHPFRVLAPITATRGQRRRFRSGERPLLREWVEAHPWTFDPHETRTALNQRKGHFYEWFAAAHFSETRGWHSLIESYQWKTQTWKRGVVSRLGGDGLLRFFDTQRRRGFGMRHAPDLLVFAPDFSDYFFCEVKGPGDRLRRVQIEYFEAVAEVSGKEIVVLPVELV